MEIFCMSTTKENWWKLVEDNWGKLLELIHAFWVNDTKLEITAPAAEEARKFVLGTMPKDFDYELLKAQRDVRLGDFFESLYWTIPESTECWRYEGFPILADLCSESYCFYEDEK